MLRPADVVEQERSFWCWAAVVQMLQRSFGLAERRQCEIVGTRLKRDCCEEPTPAPCNVPHRMESLDGLLRSEGITCHGGVLQGPLDERTLEAELAGERPVVIGWTWDRGGGHFVLVFGRPKVRAKKPSKKLYWVADPTRGIRQLTYETLRKPLDGRWSWSWYNLRVP